MRCSIEPRDRIYVKDDRFLSFDKISGKNIGKNISEILTGKYSQNILDHPKKSGTDAFKTASIKIIKKAAESADEFIENEIADKIISNINHAKRWKY